MANRPRVFLDINIGEQEIGRLIIELFVDQTPRTCENFRQFCNGTNGVSYAKVPFHRVIDEFMIQGGDIKNGDGTGTTSIYNGEAFADENLTWREIDAAGLVASANSGKDTNGSQFFITLEPCEHLNGKHTIFGRLVSGEETLHRIAKVRVDKQDRPTLPVLVARCGELERKKKPKHDSTQDAANQNNGYERGRRRKSGQSDDEMDVTPPPGRRSRRQSDNVVDEGLRGRPRLRSASRRSTSNPVEEASEEEDTSDHSPVKKHKRKRSSSPSRHLDRRSEEAGFERRRRSLPNQYNDGQHGRGHADGDRYRPSPRRDDYSQSSRGRSDNRYRPSRDRNQDDGRLNDDGRLGGGSHDEHEPPVRFKGRGVMKYREPGRL